MVDSKDSEISSDTTSQPFVQIYPNRPPYESLRQPTPGLIESNDRSHGLIVSKCGLITPKTNILVDPTCPIEGYIVHRPDSSLFDIVVSEDVALLRDTESLRLFKQVNPDPHPATEKDYLDNLIVHEYAHIFDFTGPVRILRNDVKIKDIPEEIRVAAYEAFAWWFAGMVTTHNMYLGYILDAYEDNLDTGALSILFQSFTKAEQIKGFQSVLNNRRIALQKLMGALGIR